MEATKSEIAMGDSVKSDLEREKLKIYDIEGVGDC